MAFYPIIRLKLYARFQPNVISYNLKLLRFFKVQNAS